MDSQGSETLQVRCCIVGGGPAGMMLGFLLARAGVEVLVLEKHADFLRDFRGDTIHPSTLEVMHELGLLEEFLKRPHQKVQLVRVQIEDTLLTLADFSHMPTYCKFVALMPQWDFLNFLAEQGRRFPTFRLRMQAEATDLIRDGRRITGVRVKAPDGDLEVRADLVVGADGRRSIIREKAGLAVTDLGAPMDVLWMRLPRQSTDPAQLLGRVAAGRMLVMIDRESYWQCAFVIPKGAFEEIRQRGLESFREIIVELAPFLKDRVAELQDWDDIKLLTVAVDRLNEWSKPGLLCIGDAAHAMSPIGGIGINLAIQDAVATANILASPLRSGLVGEQELAKVQKRRELPTRLMQGLQILVQNRLIRHVLSGGAIKPPWIMRLIDRWPILRRIPARLIGLGIRPEHVR
ncbi:FAD-dependent oxidoreductase [Microvirga sp. 2TAF3]|uniref:FAD-dependent oxidoreductase n=1 Tax=Microvirga sp. 2TAF3 TaxID=3233014 RepID=UPI003F9A9222